MAGKTAKGGKPDKGAKAPKGKKKNKSENSEKLTTGDAAETKMPDASEIISLPNENIPKIEKDVAGGDFDENQPTKKTGKAKGKANKGGGDAKAAKAAKARKSNIKTGKTSKDEKPKKVDAKIQKGGKLDKAPKKVVIEVASSAPLEISPPGEADEYATHSSAEHLLEKDEYSIDEEGSEEEDQQPEEEPSEIPIVIDNIEEEIQEEAFEEKVAEEQSVYSTDSESEDKFADVIFRSEDRKILKKEVDPFETIGHLPDLDQISIDSSILRYKNKIEGIVIYDEDDTEPEAAEEAVPKEEVAEIVEESKMPIEDIFSSEISLEYDFESGSEEEIVEGPLEKVSDENLFEALIKLEDAPITIQYLDYDILERQAEERQMREDIIEYLRDLIGNIVDFVEYVDAKKALREKFDKNNLFRTLAYLLENHISEKKVNSFLLRKCVYYYRRQKTLGPIMPDQIATINEDVVKYNNNLDDLNSLLGKETEQSQIISEKVTAIEQEAEETRVEFESSLANLNSFIRKTFAKRGSDRFNMFVDKRIREMNNLRQEISDKRRVFIQRQHTMARLNVKMDALEYVAPGLCVRDYETLQSEAYTLVKKLEERSYDLERYRFCFNSHTNTLAHVREKETAIYHLIQTQLSLLNEVLSEKQDLRARIHQLKTSRVRVKRQIREMSHQCGLIDKPALCIDYDETLEKCIQLREDVKNLSNNAALLNEKIVYYDNCSQDLLHHS